MRRQELVNAMTGGSRGAENRFFLKQFGVNLLMVIAMTVLMTVLIFHGRVAVPLWGAGNLAFDLVPSTVLPCIGATAGISKVMAMGIKQGLIAPAPSWASGVLPKNDLAAGLVIGLCLLAVLGPVFIGLIGYVYGGGPVKYADLLPWKLVYGLIMTGLNTPIIIARARARSVQGLDKYQAL